MCSQDILDFFSVWHEDRCAVILKKVLKLWIDEDWSIRILAQLHYTTNEGLRNHTLIIILENDSVERIDLAFEGMKNFIFNRSFNIVPRFMIDAEHMLTTGNDARLDGRWTSC